MYRKFEEVGVRVPDILYHTHEKAPEITATFLANQQSNETKQAYFRILKAFLRWCEAHVSIEHMPDSLQPSAESNERAGLRVLSTRDIKRYIEGLVRVKARWAQRRTAPGPKRACPANP
jgi:hypothetical protein